MGLWSLLVTRFPGMSLKGRKKENLFFVVLKSCTLRIETLYTLVTLIIFSLKQRREKKHDFLLFFWMHYKHFVWKRHFMWDVGGREAIILISYLKMVATGLPFIIALGHINLSPIPYYQCQNFQLKEEKEKKECSLLPKLTCPNAKTNIMQMQRRNMNYNIAQYIMLALKETNVKPLMGFPSPLMPYG